jgi:ATP-dependent Clp protease ATP-binding subunit ClpC
VLDGALAREGLLRRGLEVTYAPEVVDRLVELGFDVRYGARPLKRAVEQHAVAPIAALVAQASDAPPKRVRLSVNGEGVIEAAPSAAG